MPADHVRRTLGPRSWPRVALAPALVAAVVAVDGVVAARQPALAVHGVLDEIGHLATAGVLLAVGLRLLPPTGRPRPALVAVALASAVLIDADHVPAVLGWEGLTAGTPRPYPHSVATLAVLAATAGVLPRRARPYALAAMAGVAMHFVRDVATAPIALWWPLSWSGQQAPYSVYLAVMAALAVLDASAAARRPVIIDLRDQAPAPAQRRAPGGAPAAAAEGPGPGGSPRAGATAQR